MWYIGTIIDEDVDDVSAKPKAGPHRWKPGESGNPRGMERGSRHKASLIAENLLDGECQRLTRQAIELALNGDPQALTMCLERILPPARERPCSFKLPPISTAAEAACMARVLEGMASGEILAGEGAALSATISAYVKILETTEIEARISALEAREKIAEDA
jgi:Family of unknown function (DUF5681)